MSGESQLAYLRQFSSIDCDTLDFHVAKNFGPFIDATSNQAIAYFELLKESNAAIIAKAADFAQDQHIDETKRIACGVKAMMVLLSLQMLPYISGRVHTQTTMHAAHSKTATIQDAQEIINIYKLLSPGISTDRICIKIPATWEGLGACQVLEAQGIRTLATTVFSVEQAILAHEVGCSYVAPYINELKVHFVTGSVDENKAFPVVKEIFRYYGTNGSKTRILPASLVSTEEVLSLTGIHHITISPALLQELAFTRVADGLSPPYSTEIAHQKHPEQKPSPYDETSYKNAFEANTEAVRKLEEALAWFRKFELEMEGMMRKALREL